MNKSGPIIVIEDDIDDQAVLIEIFKRLGYANEIVYFIDGNKALDYLNQTDVQPFLVLSDINMPKINGFELRNKIFTNEQLKLARRNAFLPVLYNFFDSIFQALH